MKKGNDKSSEKGLFKGALFSLISIATLFCAMLLSGFLLFGSGLGWFSSNHQTHGGGINLSAPKKEILVSGYAMRDSSVVGLGDMTEVGTVPFFFDLPGASETIILEVFNASDRTISISSIGLDRPSEIEETSILIGGDEYWLSTQIKVLAKQISTAGDSVTSADFSSAFDHSDGEGVFLAESSGGQVRREAVMLYGGEVLLGSGEKMHLAVKLTFWNNLGASQNIYSHFGASGAGPWCRRRFYVIFS